ncbi:hypothetical protein PENTCL1PPCAC_15355, partial [Pristionchus entomophagus]
FSFGWRFTMDEAFHEASSSFYIIAHTSSASDLSGQRTLFGIDPFEDPVVGLERVAQSQVRRRRRPTETVESAQELVETHPVSTKVESLYYEICQNQLYRDAEYSADHQIREGRLERNRWIVCFMIGICTALAGIVINIIVHLSTNFKLDYVLQTLVATCDEQGAISSGRCIWLVQAAWTAYNCAMVSIAACLVIFWSPITAGSGIPQIKCFLNGIDIPEVVHLRTLVIKVLGVSAAASGGICAGKASEPPTHP